MYILKDFTNHAKTGGYLQLQLDGERVCDFFPYARGADEEWVREQANRIMNYANTLAPKRR